MGFRLLRKTEIEQYVSDIADRLIVESWSQSRPVHYLKEISSGKPTTIGRVPQSIFKWFELVECYEQPVGINVCWRRFK
jgi:hypothetical protein